MNQLLKNKNASALRLFAFNVLNPDVTPCEGLFSKTTAEDVDEAEKEFKEWFEKAFSGTDNDSVNKANEAYFATIGSWTAARQEAFESGMQTGAKLMLELMGVSLNRE